MYDMLICSTNETERCAIFFTSVNLSSPYICYGLGLRPGDASAWKQARHRRRAPSHHGYRAVQQARHGPTDARLCSNRAYRRALGASKLSKQASPQA